MIIFATNHDESTNESIKIAKLVIEPNDILLLEEKATRTELLTLLEKYKKDSLLIFSHGERNFCVGNDDLPALMLVDINLLANRSVYAYACWTAVELGQKAAQQPNSLYAGYNNVVITGGSEIPTEMQIIFSFIKNHFHLSKKASHITEFIQAMSVLCTQIEQNYLSRYPESLDYIGISTTLRNIWAKLEIWTNNQKYTHPDAIEPPLW